MQGQDIWNIHVMGTCSIFCLFLAFAHPDEWYFLMISQDKVRECNAVDHHSCITKSQDFFNFLGEGGGVLFAETSHKLQETNCFQRDWFSVMFEALLGYGYSVYRFRLILINAGLLISS